MGAWGFGLFQSDHDLDIIGELSHETGVEKFVDQVKQHMKQNAANHSPKEATESDLTDDDMYLCIFGNMCSDFELELIRKHLDSGVLATMMEKYLTKLLDGGNEPFRHPGYIFTILGACAMTLGCTIPKRFMTAMQKVYTCVELPQDALVQMKKALYGPDGYKNGVPYDFESPGLIETMNAGDAKPNSSGIIGFNVWGPGTMFYQPPKGSTKGLQELKAQRAESKHGKNVCGGCGAREGKDGAALLTCGKCKDRKYCGKDCQKEAWKLHKTVCKVPAAGKENAAL